MYKLLICQLWIKEIKFDIIFFCYRLFWDVLYPFRNFIFMLRPFEGARDGTLFLSEDWEFQSDHAL